MKKLVGYLKITWCYLKDFCCILKKFKGKITYLLQHEKNNIPQF